MLKIILADDEVWVRRALIEQIDWNGLGAQLIAEARNGEEALSLALKLKPDILITDIKMPVLDGLQVMEALEKDLPSCKVILISGYSDFALVKKALQHHAVNYVLKPIDMEDLNRSLRQAAILIEEQLQRSLSFPALKEKYLNQLLEASPLTEEIFNKTLQAIGISPKKDQFQMACMVITNYDTLAKQSGMAEFEMLLSGYFDASFTGQESILFHSRTYLNSFFVILCYASEITQVTANRLTMQRITEFQNFLRCKDIFCRIGVGRLYSGVAGIPSSAREAVYAQRQSMDQSNAETEFYDNLQKQNTDFTLAQITAYMEKHYSEQLTLQSVAKHFYLNASYLSRQFKFQTGINFLDYLTDLRISHAKELMKSRNLKVHEVAQMVGYPNHNYFAKLFKKFEGIAPSEYSGSPESKEVLEHS